MVWYCTTYLMHCDTLVDTVNLMKFDFFKLVSRCIIRCCTNHNLQFLHQCHWWISKTLKRIVPWISWLTSPWMWNMLLVFGLPDLSLVPPTSPQYQPKNSHVSRARNVTKQKVSRFSRKSRPTGRSKWIGPQLSCQWYWLKMIAPPIVVPT